MNHFTLESRIEGYEPYWELEWCGSTLEGAIEEKNRMLDKYNVYDIFRITLWNDGMKHNVIYYDGRNERNPLD